MPLTALEARLLILDNPKPWNPTPIVTQLALMITADQVPTTHNTRGRTISVYIQEWIMERGKEFIAEKHAFASRLMNSYGRTYTTVALSEADPCVTFRIQTDLWDYGLNGRIVKLEEDGIELNCEVSNIKWQIVVEPQDE